MDTNYNISRTNDLMELYTKKIHCGAVSFISMLRSGWYLTNALIEIPTYH